MDAEKFELLMGQARAYLSLSIALKSQSYISSITYLKRAKKCLDMAELYRMPNNVLPLKRAA